MNQLPTYEIDLALDDVSGTFSAKMTLYYNNLTGSALTELPLILHPSTAIELGVDPKEAGSITVTDVATSAPNTTFEGARPTLVVVRFDEL